VLRQQEGWALLQVMDTGPGISAEDMPRLFERFFRSDPSRSRAAGGTGLGLAIARQLALSHGGDLRVENRAEGGALFTLHLPL
jgi:signal transduction histidine kinase